MLAVSRADELSCQRPLGRDKLFVRDLCCSWWGERRTTSKPKPVGSSTSRTAGLDDWLFPTSCNKVLALF